MKILEFASSFIVLEDIRVVSVKSQKIEYGIVSDDDDDGRERWYIKIVYKNDSIFKTYYSSRGEAMIGYYKILNAIKDTSGEQRSID